MHNTGTWGEVDKQVLQAFIIEIHAFGGHTHKVWRRRDIDTAHWKRLLQIAEGDHLLGSSTVIAWQDQENTWHPLIDLEITTLAELIYTR